MRRQTAVRRLQIIAERCERIAGLWEDQPVMRGAYTFGPLLEGIPDVPVVQVAFVLDLPADELPWCVRPAASSGLQSLLEVDKAPVDWYWRPAARPVWNHAIRRPMRFWSPEGTDHAALDALTRGEVEHLRLTSPSREQEEEQLAAELASSLAHLRSVEDAYWEEDWRRAHRGGGVYPEQHLWEAVHGYLDLLSAVQEVRAEERPGVSEVSELSQQVVARYFEMWNTGDSSIALEILSPDWVDHAHPEVIGPQGVGQAVEKVRAAQPDLQFQVEAILGDGALVAVVGSVRGRPDPGTAASRLIWLIRLKDGRMTEMWTYRDGSL